MTRQKKSDRGSVTIWLAMASFVMICLVGLAVDISGQIYTQQRVTDVARQAARVGGQQLDSSSVIRGSTVVASNAEAVAAARSYLTAAGIDGTVTINDATIHVTATDTYPTRFLSIIGIGSLRVTGKSEAAAIRVDAGTRR